MNLLCCEYYHNYDNQLYKEITNLNIFKMASLYYKIDIQVMDASQV